MRFLFVMHYPGYLRYYDSTVRGLAERGHTVCVAFDAPHKQNEGLEALKGTNKRIVVLGPSAKRRDVWAVLARDVRRAIDFARYLDPRLADARYLRDRMAKIVPPSFQRLTRIHHLGPRRLNALLWCLRAVERAIPSSPDFERFIRSAKPDAVLVTPLVTDGSAQTDVLKAARRLGLPTALCVASWDHLTTKGMIREDPDVVVVWNEAQRQEAVALHGVQPDRVVVTGAQPFDKWFERPPSEVAAFCHRSGLPTDRPYVLFVGSTASISEPTAEVAWVRSWIAALRGANDARVRDLAVLVRPHPYNTEVWTTADLSEFMNVAIWPRDGVNPVDEGDRSDYFDSLYHSVAIVGINTSAMIEGAIVGRPVLTVLADEFADTQSGTLHFHYMTAEKGGPLQAAMSLDEHVEQLSQIVADPGPARQRAVNFVASFIRPHGLDAPATPRIVEALERLADRGRHSGRGVPVALRPLTWLLYGVAVRMTATERARRGRPPPRTKAEKAKIVGPPRSRKTAVGAG